MKSQPTLLFYRGELQHAALRRERVTPRDVRAAVRAQGFASLEDVEVVVLETAGDLTVIPRRDGGSKDALVAPASPDPT